MTSNFSTDNKYLRNRLLDVIAKVRKSLLLLSDNDINSSSLHSSEPCDIPLLVILGATASGKTSFAEKLFATDADSPYAGLGVVISADSMQVYKGLDIGTAKASLELQSRLPHRLVSVVDPDVQYCAGNFLEDVQKISVEIIKEGKLPVLVGGTGFYLKSFLEGLPETPESDENLRHELHNRLDAEGIDVLFAELQRVDPITAKKIHKNDFYRVLRGLEVFYASGQPLSSFERKPKKRTGYNFAIAGISRPRKEIYARIEERVLEMMKNGLTKEVEALMKKGFNVSSPGLQAIGYREFFATEMPLDFSSEKYLKEVTHLITHDTKRYAKRQETFFKQIFGIEWFDANSLDCVVKLIEYIDKTLTKN